VATVFIFDEETPIAFLEEIRPDIHVNGSEYGESCIEASTVKKHGGRLHIVDLLGGHSSTRLIHGR
jgi:bifunctional ADP-heptose synthase (sugar kinase/adenylyltransferase)